MTINIVLATNDAIILGCDSLSSVTKRLIDPFGKDVPFAKDADGKTITDSDGNFLVAVKSQNMVSVPTHVFGGVSKMFCLYEQDDTAVAAVTAGLATLNDVTIHTATKAFRKHCKTQELTFRTTESVAVDFLAFMRAEWERSVDYAGTDERFRPGLPNLHFLVAGYGADDNYGKVYRLDIAANTLEEEFDGTPHTGICWAGQADSVERVILGYDTRVKNSVSRAMLSGLESQRKALLAELAAQISRAAIPLPEGFQFTFTEPAEPSVPWSRAQLDIDVANLPVQYAVELASLLVNTQSGAQKFARGIATVGGRTHIGVLRRGESFRMLNEPELVHSHVGYRDDV